MSAKPPQDARPWTRLVGWMRGNFVREKPLPTPVRVVGSIGGLGLAVLAIVGLPRQLAEVVDDIEAWGGVFATAADIVRAAGGLLGGVLAGPVGQWAIVLGSAAFVVWLNVGHRHSVAPTTLEAPAPPEPPFDAGPTFNDLLIQDAIAEDAIDRAASMEDDLPLRDAMEIEGYPIERTTQVAEEQSSDPPAGWAGAFWKGKQIMRCPWGDNFMTTSHDGWIEHQDSHTEPPTPGDRDTVTRVPMPWAKVPIRFLGSGSHYIPGVPADPDFTLYTTDARATQIEATGLYERGVVAKQEHGLGAVGRHLVCKCGFEAATTPEFQSHLHANGIT